MKLCDLADGYREAAALLKVALEDAEAELETAAGMDRFRLQVKTRELREALRQARDLRRLCLTYYTQRQDPAYTCVHMAAPRIYSKDQA